MEKLKLLAPENLKIFCRTLTPIFMFKILVKLNNVADARRATEK